MGSFFEEQESFGIVGFLPVVDEGQTVLQGVVQYAKYLPMVTVFFFHSTIPRVLVVVGEEAHHHGLFRE